MEIHFDENREENCSGLGVDHHFMRRAYAQALKAFGNDEVPVGAVITHENRIVGTGYNQIEKLQDATAHAEIVAIGAAANARGTWRLNECTLYVTLEPCMMCLGAILQSRVERIVYAAGDSRFGAVESGVYREYAFPAYRRWPEVTAGVMLDESRALIQEFFRKIRQKKKGNS
ncbi:MAG: nucleoside deaminase [Fibrobacterota bacterium]